MPPCGTKARWGSTLLNNTLIGLVAHSNITNPTYFLFYLLLPKTRVIMMVLNLHVKRFELLFQVHWMILFLLMFQLRKSIVLMIVI